MVSKEETGLEGRSKVMGSDGVIGKEECGI